MINKIKKFLYDKGILKAYNTRYKIEHLKLYNDVNLYKICSNIKVQVYDKDILSSIDTCNQYNTIDKGRVYVNFNNKNYTNILLLEWFSNKGYIISDSDNVLKEWLDTVYILNDYYTRYSSDAGSGVNYSNCRILKPYYKYLINIVDIIYDCVKANK